MGLFGFLGEITSAAVKTALLPVAVVVDVKDIFTGELPETTSDLGESIGEDISDAFDKLTE